MEPNLTTHTCEQEQKLRKVIRSNANRYLKKLESIIESEDEWKLEEGISELSEFLIELKKMNTRIQLSLEDDKALDTDITQCENYDEELREGRRKLTYKLKELRRQEFRNMERMSQELPTLQREQPSTRPRLPELRLAEFAGKIEEWQSFWEQFKASIDENRSLSIIDKHIYLRNLLKGEALAMVAGIELSEGNYETVKRKLEKRYGNKELIIQSHIDYIDNMKVQTNPTPGELRKTFDELQGRMDALEALGENTEAYSRLLINKILRFFPKSMRLHWFRKTEESHENDTRLSNLLDFLNKEISRNEMVEQLDGNQSIEFKDEIRPLTAETLHIQSRYQNRKENGIRPSCVFCNTEGHWGQDCETVTNVKDRKEKLIQSQRCFLCMGKGHRMSNCTRKGSLKCYKCKSDKHHTAICKDQGEIVVNSVATGTSNPETEKIYLQTARVWVQGRNGRQKLVRCILDTGSQKSFIDTRLAEELQLEPTCREDINLKTFETTSIKRETRKMYRLTLISAVNNNSVRIETLESTNTYNTISSVPKNLQNSYKGLKFADPTEHPKDLPIQILIGSDYYWEIVQGQTIRITDNLVLVKTKFGWVMNGGKSTARVQSIQNFHISMFEDPERIDRKTLERFWDLESIGIKDETKNPRFEEEQEVMNHFQRSFRIEDGRAVVSLPWKEEAEQITNNYRAAKKRYEGLKRKFSQDELFKEQYETAMKGYYERDQIELVEEEQSTGRIYYLPHQAVIQENRDTTKVRIVFDASSHDRGSPSLNDVLYTGPNLNPEVTAALLRFRLHRTALIGDGTQAFLQLVLNQEDRDATRFIWKRMSKGKKGQVQREDEEATYRFTRLPFGLNCSPFLLAATLRTYANQRKHQFPTVAKLLGKSLYVDDFTTGTDEENEALQIYTEITALMTEIQLPMSKWASNSQKLKNEWRERNIEQRAKTKVLGINWDTETDEFWFDPTPILNVIESEFTTKRLVLSAVAKLYDPLGLITPLTITGKILFQDTWNRGLEWDNLLPYDLATRWRKWLVELSKLKEIRIPRWVATLNKEDQCREIHVFCDASERSYGAVIYLRIKTDNKIQVKMMSSKTRLAPIQRITLPRLELIAAVVGIRLLKNICAELDINVHKTVMWSDSMVTLGWIKSDSRKWKSFVSNRVTEIKSITSPEQWRYCPGKENPADHLTRGLRTEQLRTAKEWWNGPDWLRKEKTTWPKEKKTSKDIDQMKQEERRQRVNVLNVNIETSVESILDVNKINNYKKLLRIMAWILRFIKACRKLEINNMELSAIELEESKEKWIALQQRQYFLTEIDAIRRQVELPKRSTIRQFNPLLDEKGLLRVGGRIQLADGNRDEKHPIILVGKDKFTRLLIKEEHERLFHMGTRMVLAELRGKYWITHGRQIIKQVIHQCITCRKLTAQPGGQIEAPLPTERIRPTPPFETTGIDFAGPVYVKRGYNMTKSYIVLFTCAVTRAIHLELVSNMSCEKFILALQRFFGRRGVSKIIFSDNGKTFKATNRELSELWESTNGKETAQFLAHHGVTWNYIVERAAWWGGWWERMIQTTKRCLRKSVGMARLDEEEFHTLLIEIEATINSRPLTYLYGDPTEEEPLTPAHFLTGGRLTTLPMSLTQTSESNVSKVWRQRQQIMNSFWNRWIKEYLMDLRSFHCVNHRKGVEIEKDDVVLVADESRPRHMWKLGRVLETVKGRDGKCRSCVIRSPSGNICRRPVQLLYPLEIGLTKGGECEEQ